MSQTRIEIFYAPGGTGMEIFSALTETGIKVFVLQTKILRLIR